MPASERRETYLIELRPLPGVNGVRALRSALKSLLRYHRLKAVRVWRLPADDIPPMPNGNNADRRSAVQDRCDDRL